MCSLAAELRVDGGKNGPETDADSGKGCTAAAEGARWAPGAGCQGA